MKYTNRLIKESSPYLLQHAHNPVDWYPWGEEALQKAKREDIPILVSIGYAACHWCHVMEKESFEDEKVAAFMNSHFVCIKIDREERPDLDHFFMDALQAISGQGGWPLNMFLTSDARPFYGGTYFPPRRLQNRSSWMEILDQIKRACVERKDEVEEQASNLLDYLSRSNEAVGAQKADAFIESGANFGRGTLSSVFENIMRSADRSEGGFGQAPKFPQTFSILFLLRYGHRYTEQPALDQALLSLRKMIRGGIYDQVGGGFCRYSTDGFWLAPHFEKMTYDNALLLVALSEAYQISKDSEFRRAAMQTVGFMMRELRSPEGAYYSAIDADSEGEEGKFYTWSLEEYSAVLGEDAQRYAALFGVSAEGNWEGVNILTLKSSVEEWAARQDRGHQEMMGEFGQVIDQLYTARSKRVRPLTDDKIILGWNALYNHALTRASLAFGVPEWLAEAEQNMDFLLAHFFDPATARWLHTHKQGSSRFPAFLDDLAFLVQALITLYEPTGNMAYLKKAHEIMDLVIGHFSDQENCFFYFTPDFHEEIRVRKKEVYDGALPSSNAVMCWNLHKMGVLFGQATWRERAYRMLCAMQETTIKYPTSFGMWNNFLLEQVAGTDELVILGNGAVPAARRVLAQYLPHTLVMAATEPDNDFPLMSGREAKDGKLTYFACRNYACRQPVHTESALMELLLTKE